MSNATLESINASFLHKTECLAQAIGLVADETLAQQIADLRDDYNLLSTPILIDYIKSQTHQQKQAVHNKYIQLLIRENLQSRINHIYTKCLRLKPLANFSKYLKLYQQTALEIQQTTKNTNNCPCGKALIAQNGSYICRSCGYTTKAYGIVYDDKEIHLHECGARTKHSKYDSTKRCRYWLDRIQGKLGSNTEIPQAMVDRIKSCIKIVDDKKHKITCNDIRRALKYLRLSRLNAHVSYIHSQITDVECPIFSEIEITTIYQLFGRITRLLGSNFVNHGYIIYKIVEQMLSGVDEAKRRKHILSTIHLQSRNTLIKNDLLFADICKQLDGFVYRPTYR